MDAVLARELGFLGNCDQNLTIDWVYTELVKKAEQGDGMSLYKLHQIARHSEQEEIVTYTKNMIALLEGATEEESTVEESSEGNGGNNGNEGNNGNSGNESTEPGTP